MEKSRSRLRSKKFMIPLTIIAVLVAIRIALPPVILNFANNYLSDFSPIVGAHIDDIDLALIRGGTKAQGITVRLKKLDKTVMTLNEVDVSLAWRELFKGKLLMDIVADKADVIYNSKVLAEVKKIPKKKAEEAKEKALIIDIEKLDLKNSTVTLEDFEGLKKGQKLKLTDINTRVTNVTPQKEDPYSFYKFSAKLQEETPIQAAGKINLISKPIEWDVDGTIKSFSLPSANPLLRKKVPLTFTKGELDVFAEARSEQGQVEGYIKPFMKDLDIVKTEEDFKGPKHWAIEIVTAVSNILLQNVDSNSMATRIPFKFGKGVKVDTGEALEKAIQHGYEEKLTPGIENKFDIE